MYKNLPNLYTIHCIYIYNKCNDIINGWSCVKVLNRKKCSEIVTTTQTAT